MRVLVADDDPLARKYLQATLAKAGYTVETAENGQAAWAALMADTAPQVAILDWMMPGMDGIDVCREVRRLSTHSYTYLIVLTAKGEKEDIITGLEAGADDYLIKPVDPAELRARLTGARRIIILQNELLGLCDELRRQADHDSLTNLWNHAAILRRLDQEVARATRQETSLGVVMGDLDRFKEINDRHGHQIGDKVLGEVSRTFCDMLRPYDSVGRYGGEEFLLLLPGCDITTCWRLADRLRQRVGAHPIAEIRADLTVTVSFGATVFDPAERPSPARLLQAADSALYRAKHLGRNRVEFCLPSSIPSTETIADGSELSVPELAIR